MSGEISARDVELILGEFADDLAQVIGPEVHHTMVNCHAMSLAQASALPAATAHAVSSSE